MMESKILRLLLFLCHLCLFTPTCKHTKEHLHLPIGSYELTSGAHGLKPTQECFIT